MAGRKSQIPEAARRLGNMCVDARTKKKRITVAELAERAQVGTSTIVTLEGNAPGASKRLAELLARPRARRNLPRILAQISLALDEDPRAWLEQLNALDERTRLTETEMAELVARARSKLGERRRGASESGFLGEVRAALAHADAEVPVPVFFLTAGGEDEAQRTFYTRLVGLILGAISPRLVVKDVTGEVGKFSTMMEGLTADQPLYRMIVGPWSMVARSRFHVTFTPIPCWRHRLACLTHPDNATRLTWEDVRSAARNRSRRGLRVVTIEDEAGDVYLRAYCGFHKSTLHRQRDHRLPELARELARLIEEGPERTVAVLGEYEARTVRNDFFRATGVRLVDLASDRSAYAPRYPLSIVTAEADPLWSDTIRRALVELFSSCPALVAEVYGTYILDVLGECIEIDVRSRKEVLTELFERDTHLVPGYLQLTEPEIPTPRSSNESLKAFLVTQLPSLQLGDRKRKDSVEELAHLIDKMVPWLIPPEERILQGIASLERRLAGLEERLGLRPGEGTPPDQPS